MKKMKHRIVEHMSSSTADALGLSRAILCNGEFKEISVCLFNYYYHTYLNNIIILYCIVQ